MEKDIKYLEAKKRVKQVKGFYIHALVFVLVNLFIIVLKLTKNEQDEIHVWGIGLWGIGLAIHGLSVFLPNFILGKNWEEKKIQEIMNKNQNK